MTIYQHPRFARSFERLESRVRRQAETKIEFFRRDCFDARLDTHRLHGKLKRFWSFSVNQQYRILFEFLDKPHNEIVFLDIGTHAIYK